MARLSGRGWKNSWWRRVAGKNTQQEEWEKLLRMAKNHCILHMPME